MPGPAGDPFVEDALARYVATPSVNPAFTEEPSGEAALAALVATDLREAGLEVSIVSVGPGRDSVVGRLRGRGGGRSLMLNAHLDTVGPGGMEQPFEPRREGRRLHGRGAYDMKAGLASCVAAARALAAGPPLAGDVVVTAVADEEHASLGMQAVLETVRTDGAVVTEPTELEVCVAHKGFLWLEVVTHGRAAHGSRFREGVDANLRMGRVLSALDPLEASLRERSPHPLLGPPSMHAGTLHGGAGLSVYADRCVLGLERRTVPGERTDAIVAELQAILDRLAVEDPDFRADVRVLLERAPFEAQADSSVVAALDASAAAVLAGPRPRQGGSYWMDAAFIQAAGIDTVVFGPAGTGAHADIEWVDLDSVQRHCRVLQDTARAYCDG
ncbi:MAG: M20/M25/M40 family metallo-hydrolase [Gemmatimonadetes bacterium]|nr:M20/M25/M40 family metallo-hydrolase [Gemmatimonadota bacterium]